MVMIDLGHLEELINLLRAKGVISFESEDLKLYLQPPESPQTIQSTSNSNPNPPKTMWEHASLWPGGKPPEFPK